jgi:hypothetical protein
MAKFVPIDESKTRFINIDVTASIISIRSLNPHTPNPPNPKSEATLANGGVIEFKMDVCDLAIMLDDVCV